MHGLSLSGEHMYLAQSQECLGMEHVHGVPIQKQLGAAPGVRRNPAMIIGPPSALNTCRTPQNNIMQKHLDIRRVHSISHLLRVLRLHHKLKKAKSTARTRIVNGLQS
jgi:hypothetical protein